jgi:hypothetical protein
MSYDSQTSTTLINKLRKDVDSLTLKVAVLVDSKPSGTSGGTGVATTWTTRDLNTIQSDPNALILQLESNTFQLAAGAYQIRAMAGFRHTGHTRMRIYDVTGGAVIGYSVSSEVSNQANTYIDLNVRVQPHKANVYRLEYYISASGTDHLGIPASLTSISEIFAICEITRLDTGMTKPNGVSVIQGASSGGGGGTGDVTGPSISVDGDVAVFNGVSGKVIKVGTTTGTGAIVRAASPTLTTPILGTPTSGTLTNCTMPRAVETTGITCGNKKLVGRYSAGSGSVEQITLGTGLVMSAGGTLDWAGTEDGYVIGPGPSASENQIATFTNDQGNQIGSANWAIYSGDIYGIAGATSMTYGFAWIPAAAGAPTGVVQQADTLNNRVPLYFDTDDEVLYVYGTAGWVPINP